MYKSILIKIQKSKFFRWFSIFIDSFSNRNWYDFPLGRTIRASKKVYLDLWEREKKNQYLEIDDFEKIMNYKIDNKWFNDLALHTQVVIKSSPLCWQHGRVLFTSLSNWLNTHPIETNPIVTIWETGTARGFSSLCMSKALDEQKRFAHIVTFDVLPHNQKMYWNCIDDHDGPKTRAELLKPWQNLSSNYIIYIQGDSKISIKKTASQRINFAFLDGSHTFDDVMHEFNQIKQYQKSGDVIVFDDYSVTQFPGLVRAVDFICKDSNYSRKDISANKSRGYVIATKE